MRLVVNMLNSKIFSPKQANSMPAKFRLFSGREPIARTPLLHRITYAAASLALLVSFSQFLFSGCDSFHGDKKAAVAASKPHVKKAPPANGDKNSEFSENPGNGKWHQEISIAQEPGRENVLSLNTSRSPQILVYATGRDGKIETIPLDAPGFELSAGTVAHPIDPRTPSRFALFSHTGGIMKMAVIFADPPFIVRGVFSLDNWNGSESALKGISVSYSFDGAGPAKMHVSASGMPGTYILDNSLSTVSYHPQLPPAAAGILTPAQNPAVPLPAEKKDSAKAPVRKAIRFIER